MIYDKHANLKYKYGNRHFWAEGYYVSTVGLNEATIKFQIGKICCHHCIIRHFQFRKCLPVNSNARCKKGHDGIKGTVVEDYQGTLVHDHDVTFYKYGTGHQECLAHVLRYLKDSMDNEKDRT